MHRKRHGGAEIAAMRLPRLAAALVVLGACVLVVLVAARTRGSRVAVGSETGAPAHLRAAGESPSAELAPHRTEVGSEVPKSPLRPEVRFWNESGERVRGVSVWQLGGGDAKPCSPAPDGAWRLEPAPLYLARAAGFCDCRFALLPDTEAPHDVVLREGAWIAGVVETPPGTQLPADLRVLAWPDDDPQSSSVGSELLALWDRNPLARLVTPNPDGTFRIEGLEREHTYSLRAAGTGCLSWEPVTGIRPGEAGVVLAIERICALSLVFVGSDGEPAELPAGLWGLADEPVRVNPRQELSRISSDFGPALGVAGLEGGRFSYRHPVLLFRDADGRAALVPIDLRVRFPGYQPLDTVVFASQVNAEYRPLDVPLVPIADGFGRLQLGLRGLPTDLRTFRDTLLGYLTFQSQTASFSCKVQLSDAPTFEVGGVPAGEYQVTFRLAHGLSSFDQGALRVTRGKTVETQVDLSTLRSLELRLSDLDGLPSRREFLAELSHQTAGGSWRNASRTLIAPRDSFSGRVLVPGLPPGRVRLILLSPFQRAGAEPAAELQIEVNDPLQAVELVELDPRLR